METAGAFLASMLPLALIAGLFLFLARRWRKQQRSEPPASSPKPSRTRSVTLLTVFVVIAAPVSGLIGGWTLESLLMPVGYLLTGLALFLLDRFLDRHVHGRSPKVVGPIPFWWVLVWMAPLGWGGGMVTSADSPWPTWLQIVVLVGLSMAAATAFCIRFGLRFGR